MKLELVFAHFALVHHSVKCLVMLQFPFGFESIWTLEAVVGQILYVTFVIMLVYFFLSLEVKWNDTFYAFERLFKLVAVNKEF